MKHLKFFFIFAVLLTIGTTVYGQDVTINGKNGSTVAARPQGSSDYDTFFKCGGFATWQPEQLSMVLTVADATDLTPNMQLDNPANNLFISNDGEKMQIAKGYSNYPTCYVSISLPKGYRFTQYSITFSKSGETKTLSGTGGTSVDFNQSGTTRFGETGSDFATYTNYRDVTIGSGSETISRTEMTEGDMGNVLYFKLQNPYDSGNGHRALITLENAKFYFTAEENYTPVAPVTAVSNVSAVDIPFPTSRVDFGRISKETYNGVSRVSYSSANVTDLEGNFTLYEAESIKDGTGIDGISGKVVDTKAGTISSVGNYFKVGGVKDANNANKEQVYYIESPNFVEVSDGTQVPVGYRIVGANIEYTNEAVVGERTFYIRYDYTSYGYTTNYYLYTNGNSVSWETRNNRRMQWTMDADGYIRSSNGYYLVFNQAYAGVQSTKPAESERFAIDENGNIYQKGWPDYYIRFSGDSWDNVALVSNTTGSNAYITNISNTMEDLSVDNFTLTIYGKDGSKIEDVNVTGEGSYPLTGLNNDAVKFGVTGIGFVRATLTLQALDPYLSHMDVVCQDEVQTAVRMSEGFDASDFSVSGGTFYFHLPADCEGHSVAITFENLKNEYLDNTYTGGSSANNSRLNFVKSAHYNEFGTSSNNIYNKVSEAANATKERQKVGTVGTKKFKFNNADEVGTSGGTLKEYAFSLESYGTTPNNGAFEELNFTVTATDQNKVRYVFTTDETRYNIAPTTAVQHRAYAFYEMDVHVQSATYEPEVEFVPIYNNTYYSGGDDKFYGAIVTANAGTAQKPKPGYSSTQEIFKMINKCITNGVDDKGHTDVPDNANKLLYLDFSQMAGVYEIATPGGPSTPQDYSNTNAKNCLIFLPEGTSASNNNVAAKVSAGKFKASNNIILTDKEPFYSPYEISIDASKYVKYERLLTNAKNGKVTSASIIMPFNILVDENGQHKNLIINSGGAIESEESTPAFSLHQMQATNCLSDEAPAGYPVEDNVTYAFFPNVQVAKTTKANTPYIVKVLKKTEGETTSFVITQRGATIEPTTSMASDYTFTGESASGTSSRGENPSSEPYNFTSKGSFSGKKLAKTPVVFYFAQNKFVSSGDLDAAHEFVGLHPFRAVYATGALTSAISSFEIYFGEGNGTPTGITDVTKRIDTGIMGGKGTITITSAIDNKVKIYNTSGMHFMNVDMQAGETKTVNVPAGIYVVNGVKIIVK